MRTSPSLPGLLVLVLASEATAHVGAGPYPFFEIPDTYLPCIDVSDGSVDEWRDLAGQPSLVADDLLADPTVGDGAQHDPADMDYELWMAWHDASNTIWVAMERTDDVYVNEYAGDGRMWNWDSHLEFMVDGDHSGGEFVFNCADCTEEERASNYRQAQHWNAIAETPDGQYVDHVGGPDWVKGEPYAAGGGAVLGDGPVTTVTEIKVTPFDDLIYDDEAASRASELSPGKIIGFQIAIPDFDVPGHHRAFHTLTGAAYSWRDADRFTDGLLVGWDGGTSSTSTDWNDCVSTAVGSISWARIKAAFD